MASILYTTALVALISTQPTGATNATSEAVFHERHSARVTEVIASADDREPYYVRQERCERNCETFSGGKFNDPEPMVLKRSGREEKRRIEPSKNKREKERDGSHKM